MGLKIDYEVVEGTVRSVSNMINNSNVTEDYTALVSGFTESKGDQAEAIKDLLRAEGELTRQLNTTLGKFANKIKMASDEFKRLDQSMAGQVNAR